MSSTGFQPVHASTGRRESAIGQKPLDVCLIGATHPCHNPRLVREADTLAARGHRVRVVSPSLTLHNVQRDRALIARRSWTFEPVEYLPPGALNLWLRLGGKLAGLGFDLFHHRWLAERAYLPAHDRIRSVAVAEPADWFIAHAHGALPVASKAARQHGAKLGFDCEDLLAASPNEPRAVIQSIEREYLPRCDYVSVPSNSIGEALREQYGSQIDPLVLYNVFPLALARQTAPPERVAETEPLKLYWFSQTIGPGRGLEDAIIATGLLGPGTELYLRGQLATGMEECIDQLARRHGATVRLLPLIEHDELIADMGSYHVGLALERPENQNSSRTVSNKVFSYLLAGLAIAATRTPGQLEILGGSPQWGFLYEAADAQELARSLSCWRDDRDALLRARWEAWKSARQMYNWDVQQSAWLAVIEGPGQG